MSLLTFWRSNPSELEAKQISQLVALAGEGALKDGNRTSVELREFLGAVPTPLLEKYLDQCLLVSFEDSGFVLQDVVNELGSRLGCNVTPGLYRGKANAIGFDGIWRFPDGYCVVVEVKTTDAYSVSLDKLASYRTSLIKDARIPEKSSVLIVVGRKDTESLEAQVRGSRYAWDIRMISADKLLRLVQIKEAADSKSTIQKIRTVLTPLELTKVDFIVELLATTAEDIKETATEEDVEHGASEQAKTGRKFIPVAFQEQVVGRVALALGLELKKETRSLYASPEGKVSVRGVASKAHESGSNTYYWYAFHPYYRDALEEHERSYIAFGCGGPGKVLLFDLAEFVKWVPSMNTTEREDKTYWHVHFVEDQDGKIELRFRGGIPSVDVTDRLLKTITPLSSRQA
jgi:hypothetical protein